MTTLWHVEYLLAVQLLQVIRWIPSPDLLTKEGSKEREYYEEEEGDED